MSDGESAGALQTVDELVARHRKELKELTAATTALKKTATKGDKKKRKEVMAEIATMEAELSQRHAQETRELEEQQKRIEDAAEQEEKPGAVDEVAEDFASASIQDGSTEGSKDDSQPRKVNRQKLRKMKKAARMEEMRQEAENEAAAMVNTKEVEENAIQSMIAPMHLEIKHITPDGHCLFNAIADQLNVIDPSCSKSYRDLRTAAAQYMRTHPDDFMPFLVDDEGNMFTTEQFSHYCDSVEKTAVWGGQLEIRALAEALKRPVHVIQMGSPIVKMGQDHSGDPLMVSYHRHSYGLGEHYNSLRKAG